MRRDPGWPLLWTRHAATVAARDECRQHCHTPNGSVDLAHSGLVLPL
jgi:hypothetical protein